MATGWYGKWEVPGNLMKAIHTPAPVETPMIVNPEIGRALVTSFSIDDGWETHSESLSLEGWGDDIEISTVNKVTNDKVTWINASIDDTLKQDAISKKFNTLIKDSILDFAIKLQPSDSQKDKDYNGKSFEAKWMTVRVSNGMLYSIKFAKDMKLTPKDVSTVIYILLAANKKLSFLSENVIGKLKGFLEG